MGEKISQLKFLSGIPYLKIKRLLFKETGFESHREHGCLSVVSVVCCQVVVSASDRSLVQRSPTECVVSECDHEFSILRRPWPTGGLLYHVGGGFGKMGRRSFYF